MINTFAEFQANYSAAFVTHAEEGQALYPDALLSHVCVRTANNRDYERLKEFASDLGVVYTEMHGGREIAFVRLQEPLEHGDITLPWLEITAPKPGEPFYDTGAQMLVFSDPCMTPDRMSRPSAKDSAFNLNCHKKSAAMIVNAQPV